MGGVGRVIDDRDERLVRVGARAARRVGVRADATRSVGSGVAGGEDAAAHRHEVRREGQAHQLRRRRAPAPARSPACGGARRPCRRARLRRPRRNGSTAPASRPAPETPLLASTMMPSARISARVEQRRQRQDGRRRIAAGHGHQARAAQRFAMALDQPVDARAASSSGAACGPYQLLVGRRRAQPEIGREIEHDAGRARRARVAARALSPCGSARNATWPRRRPRRRRSLHSVTSSMPANCGKSLGELRGRRRAGRRRPCELDARVAERGAAPARRRCSRRRRRRRPAAGGHEHVSGGESSAWRTGSGRERHADRTSCAP